mmetsp:Transcript_29957/g.5413  ORF Transcript_29957/g.5413 Transcript_29957/m.5413 type:complete len:141 (+) Transcript_29957:752-1174(+)
MGGSAELALRINGARAPAADWGATNYLHTVEIYRRGTMNLLRKYSGTGPETSVGKISNVVWNTHNGYPKSDIVEGLVIYMDIIFKIQNPVPTGGKIVVDFEGIDVFSTNYKLNASAAPGTSDYCFVEWNGRDIDCDTLNT